MEKPPFQFGLKAVFAVMTGVAVFSATWIAFPQFPNLLALLAVQTLVGVLLGAGLVRLIELLRGTRPRS
jgi:glucose-6-phosphate-specific signal transduction histidine kinase